MRLRGDQLEAGGFVDLSCRDELGVRPQLNFFVARSPRERDDFVNESRPDSVTARRRLDEQQAKLGDGLRFGDDENRSDDLTISLGDPTPLASGIEVVDEV